MARRSKGKPKPGSGKAANSAAEPTVPVARVVERGRSIEPSIRKRGLGELAGGTACLVGAVIWMMSLPDAQPPSGGVILGLLVLALVGALGLAAGGAHLDRRADQPVRTDKRRWIYGGLSCGFFVMYALIMWKVIPNRLPSAMFHLSSVPVFTLVMAIGTLAGRRFGWWLGVVGGSLVLLSTILMIARILASAAFLAGVYGAFGKAAATFALVSVALIIELVALLPICQVRFLMSRPGRRGFGL